MTGAPDDLVGLSEAVAAIRLRQDGPNALPRPESRGFWRICIEVLREPMFVLLLAGGGVYLALGELSDAAVLIAFATLSVGIAVVQEVRSERVLEALRDLSSPTALVLRDGERRRIPACDLVVGDLIKVSEGDRVPADAVLVESRDVQADESLISGESVPVAKAAALAGAPLERPGPADGPSIYAGALLVSGQGLARVAATGAATEVGRIGRALQSIAPEPTALTKRVRTIVRLVGIAAVLICAVVVLALGLRTGSWLQGLLAGVAVGMAMIPEEFPLVLSVFMVMGAWRISRAGVLTRRSAAIETLCSATVLCTDKTGTLTQNRMTVAGGWRDGQVLTPETDATALAPLVRLGVLASAANPFDPMERAFHTAAGAGMASSEGLSLRRAYGLQSDCLAVAQIWSWSDDPSWLVAAKGAPEAILEMCRLPDAERQTIMQAVDAMARRGMRVLGIAEGRLDGRPPPDSHRGFILEFKGLVGLADPLRTDVPDAVRACRAAGVRVVMITGDHLATARSIADEAGLGSGEALIGRDLAALSDEALAQRIRDIVIFARILPEQKLRIVRALRAAGEVVAMTGDGVNDAPALKAADIGVAMGQRGSDVAREAASLVLLRDGFAPIVQTIRLGRRIYDNLRNSMSFILAVHVPLAGVALLPLVMGGGLVFGPVHIAFMEMIIDPTCSVVFEAEPEDQAIMRRPPRDPKEALFNRSQVVRCLVQGAVALVAVAGVYMFDIRRGLPLDHARASAFTVLVLTDLVLVFINRSPGGSLAQLLLRPNRSLLILAVAGLALLVCVQTIPFAQRLFQFGAPDPFGLAVALGASLAATLVLLALRRRV